MDSEALLDFWAKWDSETNIHYPLAFHMLDTFAVCRELWQACLHRGIKDWIAGQLGISEGEACGVVAFWAGLHDIGKASPDFQGKSGISKQELTDKGFNFNQKLETGHGTATACIIPELISGYGSSDMVKSVATAIGGHHGTFPTSEDIGKARSRLGNSRWDDARGKQYALMKRLCDIEDLSLTGNPGNAFFMVLAGLTSVSDWIASNEDYFPYQSAHDVEVHLDYAQIHASEAVRKLGWSGWQPVISSADTVEKLFPFITVPRPLQQEAVKLAETCGHQAGLFIIEAPTGEGKTEAAIYLADTWMANLQQRGCYFALPTMATSNQMFKRVGNYLKERYRNDSVNFMLLHGHAALSAEFATLKSRFTVDNVAAEIAAYDGASGGVVASEWFTHRKRGLLAPFGVGTIDQILLAVLQTRHVFVRLFGLAHKTIIIDEVHAYDTYMTSLLERLLQWLGAFGSLVILLSATLPHSRRDALLKAYQSGLTGEGHISLEELDPATYPRLSWANEEGLGARTIGTSGDSRKKLYFHWVNGGLPAGTEDFELGKLMREALENGGCAAVICNTVDRAQRTYSELKRYFLPDELDLLHSRYLYGDRQEREERNLKRFGKSDEHRPERAVLVATQIIEQSLDLDFDLMVTDMAPVDLLLQRAGRLQRHSRSRPQGLEKPALWIMEPKVTGGLPDFGGGTEAVYDPHILLRSWLALTGPDKESIAIPEGVEPLIEDVYGERECPLELGAAVKKRWEETKGKLEAKKEKYDSIAKVNRILPPFYEDDIFEDFNKELEEDNPSISETFQALTRLSESPSASILCLYGNLEKPCLELNSSELDTQVKPDSQMVKAVLARSIKLNHKIVRSIVDTGNKLPPAWREETLLRHHYLLFFDEHGNCKNDLSRYCVSLNDELGVIISKKQEH